MRHSMDVIHAARQDYAGGQLTTAEICVKHGLSLDSLYYWIDGGPLTGDLHLEPIPRRRRGVARIGRRRRLRGDRVSLVRRMWRTAEAQVRDIEDRLMRNNQPPDERERDTRMLAVLVKTLRELSAFKETKAMQDKAEDDDPVPRDIDEFRRELARRIRAFVDERRAGGIPGPPEEGLA